VSNQTPSSAVSLPMSELAERIALLDDFWAGLPVGARIDRIELQLHSEADYSDFDIMCALNEYEFSHVA
jgi:hypothetical protein